MIAFSILLIVLQSVFYRVITCDPLLVSQNNDIFLLEHNRTYTVVKADYPIIAFDVHELRRQIFWATETAIYRTPLYDLQTTTLVAMTRLVCSLTVDWVHNQVYWTDLAALRIEAAHLDGRGRRVLYQGTWPITHIVIDPFFGKLFWIEGTSEDSQKKVIISANFDGSDRQVVHTDRSSLTVGVIALDMVEREFYFFQSSSVTNSPSELWRLDYKGLMAPLKLLDTDLPSTQTFRNKNVFYWGCGDGVYRTFWTLEHVTIAFNNSVAVYSSLEPRAELISGGLVNATDIHILNVTMQPKGKDECAFHSCEQECVLVASRDRTPHCTCRYGFTLNPDNTTCNETGYLMYSTNTALWRVSFPGHYHTLLSQDAGHIGTFDIHIRLGYVFWIDVFREAVYRAPMDRPFRPEVVVEKVQARGLCVDWVHDHLYWTDSTSLSVASLDGTMAKKIIDKLPFPTDMAVDPFKRSIFWAECAGGLSIKRASLSGNGVMTIVDGVWCGASLTVDPNTSTLYWLDLHGSVTSYVYGGVDYGLFKDVLHRSARAIAVLDGQVIWTPIVHGKVPNGERLPFFNDDYVELPTTLKVVKVSQQPQGYDICQDRECQALCLPEEHFAITSCVCPDSDGDCFGDQTSTQSTTERSPMTELEVMEASSFHIKLKYTGWYRPDTEILVEIKEMAGLFSNQSVKPHRDIMVLTLYRTCRFSDLTPATTYMVTMRSSFFRATRSLTVNTAPPPLPIRRLPLVSLPGVDFPIQWLSRPVQYIQANLWEKGFIHRQYYLLLVSKNFVMKDAEQIRPARLRELVDMKVPGHFTTLAYYRSEEEFDDDPTMYLGNIPWGPQFWLAMVQVTEYKQTFNVDVIYSRKFSLPDPH